LSHSRWSEAAPHSRSHAGVGDGGRIGHGERELSGVEHREVDADAERGHEARGVDEQAGSRVQVCGTGRAKIDRSTEWTEWTGALCMM
jgi:hypothetical protein